MPGPALNQRYLIHLVRLFNKECPRLADYIGTHIIPKLDTHNSDRALSALVDVIIQEAALAEEGTRMAHVFHELMTGLTILAKANLERDDFFRRKCELLMLVMNRHFQLADRQRRPFKADFLKTSPELTDAATAAQDNPEPLVFVCHGTGCHSFETARRAHVDAIAEDLPGLVLRLNGPAITGGTRGSSTRSVDSNVEVIDRIARWSIAQGVQHVDVSGFSRGGYTAARVLASSRAESFLNDEGSTVTASTMMLDPVAGSLRVKPSTDTVEQREAFCFHPRVSRVKCLRAAHEERWYVPFGGNKFRHGPDARPVTYSPFVGMGTTAAAEHATAELMFLPGKHNTMVLSRHQEDGAPIEYIDAVAQLAMIEAHEHYHTSGTAQFAESGTRTAHYYSAARQKGGSVVRMTLEIENDEQRRQQQKLRLYFVMTQQLATPAGYRFSHLQQQQAVKDTCSWTSYFKPTRYQRFEALACGRYGCGLHRFINQQHYALFKSQFPNLAELLNPSDPSTLRDFIAAHSEEIQTEQARLEGAVGAEQAQFLTDRIEATRQVLASEESATLFILKARLARACQGYVDQTWPHRNRVFFATHGRTGVVRAFDLEQSFSEIENLAELSTKLYDHFLSEKGGWDAGSLNPVLADIAKEVPGFEGQFDEEGRFVAPLNHFLDLM